MDVDEVVVSNEEGSCAAVPVSSDSDCTISVSGVNTVVRRKELQQELNDISVLIVELLKRKQLIVSELTQLGGDSNISQQQEHQQCDQCSQRTQCGTCGQCSQCSHCGPCSQCSGATVERFVCFVCGTSYWTQSDCQTHWISQHAGIIISCHLCQQTFLNKSQLNAHMRTQHRNTPATNSNGTSGGTGGGTGSGTSGVEGSSSSESLGRSKRHRVSRSDRQKDFVWDVDTVDNEASSSSRIVKRKTKEKKLPENVMETELLKRDESDNTQQLKSYIGKKWDDVPELVVSGVIDRIKDRDQRLVSLLSNCALKIEASDASIAAAASDGDGSKSVHGKKYSAVTDKFGFTCRVCGKFLLLKSTFVRHMRRHSCNKFRCTECGMRCCSRPDLVAHQRVHSGLRPYLCPDCGRTFRTADQLTAHIRSHSTDRPWTCPYCDVSYKTQNNMREHVLLKHETHKLLACTQCDKQFAAPHKLRDHLLMHSGLRPFECDICHKHFHSKQRVDQHKRQMHIEYATPSSLPPPDQRQCYICKRVLSDKRSMKAHLRRHTGDAPYCCSVCDKRFVSQSDLTTHGVRHSTVQPFTCQICGSSFKRKISLRRHEQSHTTQTLYMCNYCQLVFRSNSAMYKHRQKHHSNELLLDNGTNKAFVIQLTATDNIDNGAVVIDSVINQ